MIIRLGKAPPDPRDTGLRIRRVHKMNERSTRNCGLCLHVLKNHVLAASVIGNNSNHSISYKLFQKEKAQIKWFDSSLPSPLHEEKE